MADEKKYLEVFNDGTEDLYLRDKEAQEQLSAVPATYATKQEVSDVAQIPINIDDLTPGMTFQKNSVLGINGVMYRAIRQTTDFPVVLLVEGDHVVYDEDENGNKALIVEDYTLSQDWKIYTDASIPRTLELMTQQQQDFFDQEQEEMQDFKEDVEEMVTGVIKASTLITASSGRQYTVQQLLTALADLMESTIVVNDNE